MKRLKHLLLLGIIVSFSCKDGMRPERPNDLISKEKMKEILYDLALINAAKSSDRNTLKANNISPQKYILNKHNIDSAQFANSNHYYAFDIEDYNLMVTEVQQKITNEIAFYKKQLKKEKAAEDDKKLKKSDSIIKASLETKD